MKIEVAESESIHDAIRRAFSDAYEVSVGSRYVIVTQRRRGIEKVFQIPDMPGILPATFCFDLQLLFHCLPE